MQQVDLQYAVMFSSEDFLKSTAASLVWQAFLKGNDWQLKQMCVFVCFVQLIAITT